MMTIEGEVIATCQGNDGCTTVWFADAPKARFGGIFILQLAVRYRFKCEPLPFANSPLWEVMDLEVVRA